MSRNTSKNSSIRAIIVDDELHARENLHSMLEEHCPAVKIIGMAANIPESVKLIEESEPDLLFLDIKLSGSTGFELLKQYNTRNFGVIFVTAFDNYAIKAIKFSAVDYILKPINHRELKKAVEMFQNKSRIDKKASQLELLIENLSRERSFNRIGINMDGTIEYLTVSKIIRLQGDRNYTKLFLEGQPSIMVSKTLGEFEDLLNDLGFFRVHKTHMVNLSYVKTFHRAGESRLRLKDETIIPVSRRRKADLTDKLKGLQELP